jgi:breast cancer 2 susceptibility protein
LSIESSERECNSKCEIKIGDGANLILANDDSAGLKEISQAFLASPGVEPQIVPIGWVENHYRWIVWKLASTEKSFPQFCGGK